MNKILMLMALVALMVPPKAVAETVVLAASITAPINNHNATVGQDIAFAGSGTGGNPPYSFVWTFGDGTSEGGQSFAKSYATPGDYTVTLQVGDFDRHTVEATVQVHITDSQTPAPSATLDMTINGNSGASGPVSVTADTAFTLAWTGTNLTACTASGDWSGAKAASGSETIPGISGSATKIYSLSCATTTGQNLIDSVSAVTTTSGGGDTTTLAISNIRVTDVTHNSAVIRWTTSRAADSRVIYDSTSRSITGQSGPNYGYALSSPTTDSSTPVIEHAVTITDLSPSTSYFFRVLSQG
ncbi:MAG: PKD domain-containing protein [Patescibacteria group bacterium]